MSFNPAARTFVPRQVSAPASSFHPFVPRQVSVASSSLDLPQISPSDIEAIANMFKIDGIQRLPFGPFTRYINSIGIYGETPIQQAYEQYGTEHRQYLIIAIAAAKPNWEDPQVRSCYDTLMQRGFFKRLGVGSTNGSNNNMTIENWGPAYLAGLKDRLRMMYEAGMALFRGSAKARTAPVSAGQQHSPIYDSGHVSQSPTLLPPTANAPTAPVNAVQQHSPEYDSGYVSQPPNILPPTANPADTERVASTASSRVSINASTSSAGQQHSPQYDSGYVSQSPNLSPPTTAPAERARVTSIESPIASAHRLHVNLWQSQVSQLAVPGLENSRTTPIPNEVAQPDVAGNSPLWYSDHLPKNYLLETFLRPIGAERKQPPALPTPRPRPKPTILFRPAQRAELEETYRLLRQRQRVINGLGVDLLGERIMERIRDIWRTVGARWNTPEMGGGQFGGFCENCR